MGTIYVYLIDDCEYVAAGSRDEAVAWYEREIKGDHVDDVEDISLDTQMNIASEEDDPAILATFREVIAGMESTGETFPAVIASSGYY